MCSLYRSIGPVSLWSSLESDCDVTVADVFFVFVQKHCACELLEQCGVRFVVLQ